jgi:tetratricopeptide (TPR) repeat protein
MFFSSARDKLIAGLAFLWPFLKIICIIAWTLSGGILASLIANYLFTCYTSGNCPTLSQPHQWGILQPFVSFISSPGWWVCLAIITVLSFCSYLAYRKKRLSETGREKLTRAKNLRLRSFDLGDNAAATFPYVIPPVQEKFVEAKRVLREAKSKHVSARRGIFVLGESNAGKTRLALEALKKALPHWKVLRWHKGFTWEKNAPFQASFNNKPLVLLIDDLQDYAPRQVRTIDNQLVVVDSSALDELKVVLSKLDQAAKRVIVVATCRAEQADSSAFSQFRSELAKIEIGTFSSNTDAPEVKQIFDEFRKKGTVHQNDWDGTLGSLIQGLTRKERDYKNLEETDSATAAILKAMKLLRAVGITVFSQQRLRVLCSVVFGEKKIQQEEIRWDVALKRLEKLQFVRKGKMDQRTLLPDLNIRQDIYFEKVVTTYTESDMQSDFGKLREAFVQLEDVEGLVNLSIKLSELEMIQAAIDTINYALNFASENANLFYLKGLLLYKTKQKSQFEEGLIALERSLELLASRVDKVYMTGLVWFSKGLLLYGLQRYKEAYEAFEWALYFIDPERSGIEPDKSNVRAADIWFHKALVLAELKRHQEAAEAAEQSLNLDPHGFHAAHASTIKNIEESIYLEESFIKPQIKRHEKALEADGYALPVNPDANNLYLKGIKLIFLDQYEQAVDAFDRVLAIYPNDSLVWYLKGNAYMLLQQYKQASDAFDQSLKLDPNRSDTWLSKGRVLIKAVMLEEAVAVYNQLQTMDSQKADELLKALFEFKEVVLKIVEQLASDLQTMDSQKVGELLEALFEFKEAVLKNVEQLTSQTTKPEEANEKNS